MFLRSHFPNDTSISQLLLQGRPVLWLLLGHLSLQGSLHQPPFASVCPVEGVRRQGMGSGQWTIVWLLHLCFSRSSVLMHEWNSQWPMVRAQVSFMVGLRHTVSFLIQPLEGITD